MSCKGEGRFIGITVNHLNSYVNLYSALGRLLPSDANNAYERFSLKLRKTGAMDIVSQKSAQNVFKILLGVQKDDKYQKNCDAMSFHPEYSKLVGLMFHLSTYEGRTPQRNWLNTAAPAITT
ncbi:hypothetical protein QAD02_003858 [Eretmocerus hayati]|uniref:Uncharacterized protein n=1 Tax=Eretmocerus hayati TaxID=131215 RepID=A0ACC2NND8_9HYME|nr:hypothetical protein QAD02_003858 [Eretmocerus hayati]